MLTSSHPLTSQLRTIFTNISAITAYSYFSTKTYIVGTHLKCLRCLMSKQPMCLWRNKKNINPFRCTLTILWANSAIDKVNDIFPRKQDLTLHANCLHKTGFDIASKLSPLETICMQCQILFSGKNKKNISNCRPMKILPRVLRV